MDFPNSIFRYSSMPNIISRNATLISESRSFITWTRKIPAHRFEVEVNGFTLPADTNAFSAFLFEYGDMVATFYYQIPKFGKSIATNKTVNANASIGVKSVSVTSITDVQAGDFFTFSGHNKMYQVTSTEAGQINFFPQLQKAVTTGQTVNLESPKMLVRMRNSVQSFTAASQNKPAQYSIAMIEVL